MANAWKCLQLLQFLKFFLGEVNELFLVCCRIEKSFTEMAPNARKCLQLALIFDMFTAEGPRPTLHGRPTSKVGATGLVCKRFKDA